MASAATGQGLDHILGLILSKNNSVLAAKQLQLASKHKEDGSGYVREPSVKLNLFATPLETRNGPQRASVVVTQPIPWPKALRAEKHLAASKAQLKGEKLAILLLNLHFEAKILIYKYVECSTKLASKNQRIATLNSLSKVVLARFKLGQASQAEISRINIETAGLTQSVRRIEGKMREVHQQLKSLAGGKDVRSFLPSSPDPNWGKIDNFEPSKIDISTHPLLSSVNAKIELANAGIRQAEARRLPQFAASVSWFQINRANSMMLDSDAGKDAWAIGASVSIPIWGGKYNSMERSQLAMRTAAQLERKQRELDLRADIQSTYEQYRSTTDILAIFHSDILPQATQALNANRESYTQGNVTFERVIEDYIRVIKFEDQLIESKIKQASLKAAIDKLVGRQL